MARFLVVAAGSDIGQEVVHQLMSAGHDVLTTARSSTSITPDYQVDSCDFSAMEQVFNNIGLLDGVVNCSGSLLLKPAHLTTFDEWQAVIAASLTSAFSVVRAAGQCMKQGGSVVLISSAAAQIGLANHEAIAAAKAGIIGLARSAAATYAPQGLRFNVVAPGLTETKLSQHLVSSDMMRAASVAMHPLHRLGTVTDIANAIVFLLSLENNWITGQVLAVDGGLSSIKPRVKV